MTQPRKNGIRTHLLSIGAASLAVLAVAGLAPSAPRHDQARAVAAIPALEQAAPVLPSYVVRAVPLPVAPAAPEPVRIVLEVETPVPEVAAEPAELWYVTAGALNLRSGPSSGSGQLAALPQGTAVEIGSSEGNWAEVQTADGVGGWVYAKYLSQTAPQ